jgi:hypothetical protein
MRGECVSAGSPSEWWARALGASIQFGPDSTSQRDHSNQSGGKGPAGTTAPELAGETSQLVGALSLGAFLAVIVTTWLRYIYGYFSASGSTRQLRQCTAQTSNDQSGAVAVCQLVQRSPEPSLLYKVQ